MPVKIVDSTTKRNQFDRVLSLNGEWVRSQVLRFFNNEAPFGDLTTESFIPPEKTADAQIVAGETCIFAGAELLKHCFNDITNLEIKVNDGEKTEVGKAIAFLRGSARDILTRERVVLNLLQRLSGIATNVGRYVDVSSPEGFMIVDTRKPTSGLYQLEKYAIAAGGGYNHHLDLSSAMLIKDNHIAATGGLQNAEAFARCAHPDVPVELEVNTIEQVEEAREIGLDGFLLHNMTPQEVKKCVRLIRSFPDGEAVFIEASGAITLETLSDYAWTGINAVSIDALTTQAKNVDLRIDFK